MKRGLWVIAILAFLAAMAGGGAFADELMTSAEAFFKSYVDGGNHADSDIIDYFADDARILAVRHLRDGGTARIGTTGEKHKEYLKKTRRRARMSKVAMGTLTTFSDVAYNLEEGCVRITASRHVSPAQMTTPYSLLICRDGNKQWRIQEEIIETEELPAVEPGVQP